MASATAQGILEAERTILAANTRRFKTYVICPGLLYGVTANPFMPMLADITWHLSHPAAHITTQGSCIADCIWYTGTVHNCLQIPVLLALHLCVHACIGQLQAAQPDQCCTKAEPQCAKPLPTWSVRRRMGT